MMEHDFGASLKLGGCGELYVEKHFSMLLRNIILERVSAITFDYDTPIGKKNQKEGKDGIVTMEPISIEVKTRDKKYNDILLETMSDVGNKVSGWFFSSKADVIVYLWECPPIDGYVIMMDMARDWFPDEESLKEFGFRYVTTSNWRGEGYSTRFVCVPFNMFPDGCLINIKNNIEQVRGDNDT